MTDLLDVAAGDDHPRPILLGEAPPRAGDPYYAFPLSGRPARVLCELAGIPPQPDGTRYGRWTWALYERFECRNLFERYADATPWSAPKAREVARAALADAQAAAAVTAGVDLATVDPAIVLATSPTIIVCLGRRVQSAVFAALDGDISRPLKTRPGAWNTGVFGDFGVWAAPRHIHTPVVRRVCRHCRETPGATRAICPPSASGAHDYIDDRVRRWAPHVVTIPHPSGLNRLLNDESTRHLCGDVLRRAIELAAVGPGMS